MPSPSWTRPSPGAPLVDGKAKLDGEEIRELMGTVPDAVFERMPGIHRGGAKRGRNGGAQPPAQQTGNSPSQMARQLVRYLRNCLMAKLGGERNGTAPDLRR